MTRKQKVDLSGGDMIDALAKAAGCNRFQGYHFARPAPKEQLVRLFGRDGTGLTSLAG